MKTYYFKQSVTIEPLINNWYAWVHLIPPVTSALNIVHKQIKIMESFVNAPELHVEAQNDPKLRGGPFLDLPSDKVDDIRDLLVTMKSSLDSQLELSRSIKELDMMMVGHDGSSLQQKYDLVPENLAGLVELQLDRYHRATFRIIEPLLYKSKYYINEMQSFMVTNLESDVERKFIFSTPRVEDISRLQIRTPFKSKQADFLFSLKTNPATIDEIQDRLRIPDKKLELLRTLLTTESYLFKEKYDSGRMRIKYFGHACVLLETNDIAVLVDPLISYKLETGLSRYSFIDLPKIIDYVLITHAHHDHVLLETLFQLKSQIGTIVVGRSENGELHDPSLLHLLRNVGFENVIDIEEFDTIREGKTSIQGLPFIGEHHDLRLGNKLCFKITYEDKSVLFAADSCNFDHNIYSQSSEFMDDIDVLFLGMECEGAPASWVYGPLFTFKQGRNKDYSRRGRGSNFEEAKNLVNQLGCKQAYVYAMGAEPWVHFLLDLEFDDKSFSLTESDRFVKYCNENGVTSKRLFGKDEILI